MNYLLTAHCLLLTDMNVQYLFLKAVPWLVAVTLFLNVTGCAGGATGRGSEDPLIQLQNQVVALRKEINQSLRKMENERESLSQKLEPLQRNQADYLANSEEIKSKLQAIEAKLVEYTERMAQLAESMNTLQTKVGEIVEARQIGNTSVSVLPSPVLTNPTPPQLAGTNLNTNTTSLQATSKNLTANPVSPQVTGTTSNPNPVPFPVPSQETGTNPSNPETPLPPQPSVP
ncbi:MAG: hypothetical protein L0Y56_17840, partial [Nitrospira sp.]|nr:hypothetical protein [Nitrospira sp.]